MDAAGRQEQPRPATAMSRVVVTFTSDDGVSQVSLAKLQTPGVFQRYWVEDHQPLARLRLGNRLRDVECTRATPQDEDFGTKSWPRMRVAKNEPYPTGDHLVVLEPLEERETAGAADEAEETPPPPARAHGTPRTHAPMPARPHAPTPPAPRRPTPVAPVVPPTRPPPSAPPRPRPR
jgi:hypothetical protein